MLTLGPYGDTQTFLFKKAASISLTGRRSTAPIMDTWNPFNYKQTQQKLAYVTATNVLSGLEEYLIKQLAQNVKQKRFMPLFGQQKRTGRNMIPQIGPLFLWINTMSNAMRMRHFIHSTCSQMSTCLFMSIHVVHYFKY